MKVTQAEFVKSATKPSQFPEQGLPEIAFAGRSNVGKSSLINALCGRKKLVKVSGKPGHTRVINFFRINDLLSFVDLPGYGYARVAKTEREAWSRMVESYFAERTALKGVVCIMDIRRGPEDDDMMLVQAAPLFGFQPILVFTKADKLSRNKRFQRRRQLSEQLRCSVEELILFSSTTSLGHDELWDRIVRLTGVGE